MELEPIGVVKSPITEGIDENWGEMIAEIEIDEELAPGLQGLEAFSHILVIFHMHEAGFQPGSDLLRRPRGQMDMPRLGIFAQQAKYRPNPIGITAVQLLDIQGDIVRVKGLDAIDGTPVLDLKPYFPVFDHVDDVRVPEWVGRLMQGYF